MTLPLLDPTQKSAGQTEKAAAHSLMRQLPPLLWAAGDTSKRRAA